MEYFVVVKSLLEGQPTIQVFRRNGQSVGEYLEGSSKIPKGIRVCETISEFNSVMIDYDFLH